MNTIMRGQGRTVWAAVRAMALFTVLLGIGYTGAITLVGQVALGEQAGGSLRSTASGEVVGSALIGQSFSDATGDPLAWYFQPRPSAAGSGYDAAASSGSNLGPENDELVAAIADRQARIAAREGVAPDEVPADAVTASASGLDPHISEAYAELQVERVAAARNLPADVVRELVAENTHGRFLGYLGEPTVNVLTLNIALDDRRE
ncbi:potassium-transporting ATPase subunit KdpC [Leucobacter sp. UCMA 4100]|uniref:potassium-transporting ATPase subunit KdpC n=1 Tax=Leucobacter sp. UCMA 4100 TaxID=2810534 RepID=UPI0022EA6C46|nr:potassium-transporting ATPase subunit KdpC [Leucobacter sp. UCMA 4100]MDA3146878.1 potassium-transporting ATPase subunit KdpC [Leucobacter sp. UCMA 4100]